MSRSPFAVARFGFFVSFIAFIATGFYAYTLRANVAKAETQASAVVAEKQALETKLAASQKTALATNDAAKSCAQREADLKIKLDQQIAADASAAQSRAKHKR